MVDVNHKYGFSGHSVNGHDHTGDCETKGLIMGVKSFKNKEITKHKNAGT